MTTFQGDLPTNQETGLMQLGQQATKAARARLIDRYAGQYRRLIVEERRARGLPAKTTAQVLAHHRGVKEPATTLNIALRKRRPSAFVRHGSHGQLIGPFPDRESAEAWLEWKGVTLGYATARIVEAVLPENA